MYLSVSKLKLPESSLVCLTFIGMTGGNKSEKQQYFGHKTSFRLSHSLSEQSVCGEKINSISSQCTVPLKLAVSLWFVPVNLRKVWSEQQEAGLHVYGTGSLQMVT